MPRYIDVDELEKMSNEATAIETKAGLMALVKLIPTIDIVRCEDCKYFHSFFCEVWSKYGTIQTRKNGYCYMAERKEDG